jgi:hypothetical protein
MARVSRHTFRQFPTSTVRVCTVVAWALAIATYSVAADATPPEGESAPAPGTSAQAQFDYGLAEMERGLLTTACPALAESYRLDPHPGVLFTLAECENREGKIASALTHYQAFLDLFDHMSRDQRVRQQARRDIAATQSDALRHSVPLLTIALPDSVPAGTVVTRDGTPLGEPSFGEAVPVDPGEHVIVATTPDGAPHPVVTVTLSAGERRSLVLDLSVSATPATPPAPLGPVPAAPALSRAAAWTPWMWGIGGIGVTSIAIGIGAGVAALGDKSTISAHCIGVACDHAGKSAADNASVVGAVSTAGFAVGGAALATLVVLALTRPTVHRATATGIRMRPVVGGDKGGAVLVGAQAVW